MLKKRVIAGVMALTMISMTTVGWASKKAADEKPVLKFLMQAQNYDVNSDPVAKKVEEVTGYKIQRYVLPTQNADQKLLLDLASGVEYDIIRLTPTQFSRVLGRKMLMDIKPLLKKYAPETQKVVSDAGWKSATVDGQVFGIPIEGGATVENPMGPIQGGILFRKDLLEKAGKKLPTNAAELKIVLKAFKDMGYIPLVATPTIIHPSIDSAFDIPSSGWRMVKNKLVNRIALPQTKEYIKFLSELSKEGLLDREYAISKADSNKTKFVAGKAAAIECYFWDVPSLEPALVKQIPGASVVMDQPLKDTSGKMHIGIGKSVDYYEVIPKSSKNAIDALKFQNLRSIESNYVQIYLGKKGETYNIQNGSYFPILPAFNAWNNASHYVGAIQSYKSKEMWQARARKTPEMAKIYDAINLNVPKDSYYMDVTKFASNLPTVRDNLSKFNQAELDTMTAIIAGTSDLGNWDKFVQTFKSTGGDRMTTEINYWYSTEGRKIK